MTGPVVRSESNFVDGVKSLPGSSTGQPRPRGWWCLLICAIDGIPRLAANSAGLKRS